MNFKQDRKDIKLRKFYPHTAIRYAFKIVCPKNVQTVALLGIHRPLGWKKLSYNLVQLPITLPFRKLRPRELRCFIQCWCRVSERQEWKPGLYIFCLPFYVPTHSFGKY